MVGPGGVAAPGHLHASQLPPRPRRVRRIASGFSSTAGAQRWQHAPMHGIDTLERLLARTWPGLEQDHLGDWLLRAAHGWTGRANSALAVGDPGPSRQEALDRVAAWYAARGLPPRVHVPLPLSRSDAAGEALSRAWPTKCGRGTSAAKAALPRVWSGCTWVLMT